MKSCTQLLMNKMNKWPRGKSFYFTETGAKSSNNLLCYSEKSGTKMQNCHSSFGFKTCFTKYNYSE